MKPEAIIFDCIGVLYISDRLSFSGSKLNTELISFIKKSLKPQYKIGLLSNIDREWIDTFLSKHHLEDLFDAVVVSGDENVAKPNAIIYQRMSERLGVTPDGCVMIDDLQENCVGAENAGMKSIRYISNEKVLKDLRKLLII